MTRPSSLPQWGDQPDAPVPPLLSAALSDLLGSFTATCVWRNSLGGLTFEVSAGHVRLFAKWAPAESGLPLREEATRLTWLNDAVPHLRVPRLLAVGGDGGEAWLVTTAVDGDSAVHPQWLSRPGHAVRAIGEGLRLLHTAVPVEACPFDWSVAQRLRQREAAVGLHRAPADLPPAPSLEEQPGIDVRVVCHGDPCSPNTLVAADGRFAGLVDLGTLGAADRWADLAVATASVTWNFGPGWEDVLLEAYGVARDDERIAFYRRLWDST